jgi:putative SOS response-associated peptidase YedK
MCFYYSITRKSINKLVKGKILKENQLSLFDEHYIVNGFDHPYMPVITDQKPGEIQHFQWGFMPAEVNDIAQTTAFLNKYNTLNAKAEEVTNSKLYADAFENRRCMVLCSGFFEWKQVKKEKIPHYITLKDDEMFVFAGIWNLTSDRKGQTVNSYAILTIDANEFMAEIHNTKKRMPLILSPQDALAWLNPDLTPDELNKIINPQHTTEFKAHTIKKFLPGNAKNIDSADIIAYYDYPHLPDLFF